MLQNAILRSLTLRCLGLGLPQSERTRDITGMINLRQILAPPAGCVWDSRRDKQGSNSRFPLVHSRNTTRKAGTAAGCPRHPRPSRVFKKLILSRVPFLPKHNGIYFCLVHVAFWRKQITRTLKFFWNSVPF